MKQLQTAWATCLFELKSSFTAQRIAVTAMLAMFPPVMLGLLILGSSLGEGGVVSPRLADLSTFISIFLVALVLLLSLLLWATPNVYSELEGKSWVFLASRPSGRVSVFLGKYFASVLVGIGISVAAATLCIVIQSVFLNTYDPVRIWVGMLIVFIPASLVYGALFSTIGAIFFKRAMLVAASYLLLFDIFLNLLTNSIIHTFTIRYHLQEIGIGSIGWFLPSGALSETEYRMYFGESMPAWIHLLIVFATTLVLLGIGIYCIISREYITSDQS